MSLIPADIPGSFCEFRIVCLILSGLASASGGAYNAPFAMCASLGDRPSGRTHGKHRHVCATHELFISFLSGLASVRRSPRSRPLMRWVPCPMGTGMNLSRNDHPTPRTQSHGEVRRQKVKLLIPGYIPGSFCEFSFPCLTRLLRPAPSVGWRIDRALCDVCELRRSASGRTHGKHRHVCATHSLSCGRRRLRTPSGPGAATLPSAPNRMVK